MGNIAEEERDDNKETLVEAAQDGGNGGDGAEGGDGEDGRDVGDKKREGDGRQPAFDILHKRVPIRYQNYFTENLSH